MHPIIDIHCDLLFYLTLDQRRTPFDHVSRTSFPQLHQGPVKLQVLVLFTETEPHSVEKGMRQFDLYHRLPTEYPKDVCHYKNDWAHEIPQIKTMTAFENASGFCKEDESLQKGFERLDAVIAKSKPLYISLTWNSENRFGGGALTNVGLKEDGKRLLEKMDGQLISLDLSHASDALAYEAIDYIEGHRLNIPVIASHSNARAVTSVPRNLPDEIAKEIFRRKGIVGFNCYRPFVGESIDHIVKHFAHWLELGGEDHLAFGADYFHEADLPSTYAFKEVFFDAFPNSSSYGSLLSLLQKELKLAPSTTKKIAHQNALDFITRCSL